MNDYQSFVGKRFGRWTVLTFVPATKHQAARGKCRCDCGTVKEVQFYTLLNRSTSCGCFSKEINSRVHFVHGESNKHTTTEYVVWLSMKARCLNKKNKHYKYYGGRGIKICDRWRNSFENFLADMGRRPKGKSIERKNNDGDYEPSNCKWATRQEQANNKSQSRFISFSGIRLTVGQWARRAGIEDATLRHRLYAGWSVRDALNKPLRPSKRIYACKSK